MAGALAGVEFGPVEAPRGVAFRQRLLHSLSTAVVFYRHRRVQHFPVLGNCFAGFSASASTDSIHLTTRAPPLVPQLLQWPER
jgi:hypothetical protein